MGYPDCVSTNSPKLRGSEEFVATQFQIHKMTIHNAGGLVVELARLSNEFVKVVVSDVTPRVVVGREQGETAIRVVQLFIPVTFGGDSLSRSVAGGRARKRENNEKK